MNLPADMRAFVCTAITEDWSGAALTRVPVPGVKADEVLMRVEAASVNGRRSAEEATCFH